MNRGKQATQFKPPLNVDPVEYCYREGWTDGLPVVPPTPGRVQAMLAATERDPMEVLGVFPPLNGELTVEKVAINAVMAGCLPEYFPVVLTAAECLRDRESGLGGLVTTIHGDSFLLIINGPVTKELGFNAAQNTFGPGWRANATVGRALQLIVRNVIAGPPGQFDSVTLAHPGKYTYCIAEFEQVSPWPSLHVERGFDTNDSAVTLVGAQGPLNVTAMVNTTARGILNVLADAMSILGTYNMYFGGETLVVLSPTHAGIIGHEGWSKDDVKHWLWEKARRPLIEAKHGGAFRFGGVHRWPKWVDTEDDTALIPAAFSPDDIIVIVAGGEIGGYSSVVFCSNAVRSVTRAISAALRREK